MRSVSIAKLRPIAAALLILPAVYVGGPVLGQEADEAFEVLAMIEGENVTGGGAEEGYAQFSGTINAAKGEICYRLEVEDLAMTAAHIHKGKEGTDGAPVVTLEDTAGEELCTKLDAKTAKSITAKPSNFYVNVHSAEFPAGALRGQLED